MPTSISSEDDDYDRDLINDGSISLNKYFDPDSVTLRLSSSLLQLQFKERVLDHQSHYLGNIKGSIYHVIRSDDICINNQPSDVLYKLTRLQSLNPKSLWFDSGK
ncbi:hypothetical protein L1887_35136 [Cichorium endivia]|nr:hypothetical protein L1887_35136 [Cichorium endivia]